jgi:hypothetical protein
MTKPTQFPTKLPTDLREVFVEAFELVSAISPASNESTHMTLAEMLVDEHLLNLDAYRLNIRLSGYAGRIKNPKEAYNYYLKDATMTGSIGETLNHSVYFENGSNSSKVVAVDMEANLVLTETGSIYRLARQIVAPIEVMMGVRPALRSPAKAWPMPTADDYACNAVLAKRYVETREEEARQFTKSLVWRNDDIRFSHCIFADVYGVRVIHDLSGYILNSGEPRWGELFQMDAEGGPESLMYFATFDNFVAYMLAKYW